MSKIFVTSDTHFGHSNIIRFCSRPFKNRVDMDSHMIDEWNRRVGIKDTVYFLGDFAMGPPATDGFIAQKLQLLNGNIKVVLGNHDQPVPKFGTSGLKKIVEDYALKIEILSDIHEMSHDGVDYVMCHYPMKDWSGKQKGSLHLHGHSHTRYTTSVARRQVAEHRYDVGVDMYGGPVALHNLGEPKGWEN